MNYFENFNEILPAPPQLPFGWTSTSTGPALPWDRVLVAPGDYAASVTEVVGISTSTLTSPPILIGPFGGTLTFDNLYNLDGVDSFVSALAIQSDGKILVGGVFGSIDNIPRHFLVRLNPDGTVDTSFHVDTDAQISVIVIDNTGRIYIGGAFSRVGTENIGGIARISSAGVVDTTFNPNPDGPVRDILLDPGLSGSIFIGGFFKNVNSISRPIIAKLNNDGSLNMTFDSSSIFILANGVTTIKLDPVNGLLIGGGFIISPGKLRIARLDPITAAPDATFLGTTDSIVNDIALDIAGGGIFLCGSFTTVNGQPRISIAKLNRNDGSLDLTFVPPTTFDNEGTKLFLDSSADLLLLEGRFTTPHNAIVRLSRSTGALFNNPNIAVDGQLFEIARAPGNPNNFFVGGFFTNIGNLNPPIQNLAIININNNTVDPNFRVLFKGIAYDATVLEIKIGANPFQDILDAGGSFVQGAYNTNIITPSNPLGLQRPAWSSLSGGTTVNPQFITTRVNLPLSTANQTIQLRWILGTDEVIIAPDLAVARIDNISIIMNPFICILPGAIVKTLRGPIKIENLRKGDTIFDENGNQVLVLQNFIIPMDKPRNTVCIKRNAFGLNKPNGLITITHDHPIKVQAGDKERKIQDFVKLTNSKKKIRSLKQKSKYVYNIVTKDRVFVNINNIFVGTWNEADLYKRLLGKK